MKRRMLLILPSHLLAPPGGRDRATVCSGARADDDKVIVELRRRCRRAGDSRVRHGYLGAFTLRFRRGWGGLGEEAVERPQARYPGSREPGPDPTARGVHGGLHPQYHPSGRFEIAVLVDEGGRLPCLTPEDHRPHEHAKGTNSQGQREPQSSNRGFSSPRAEHLGQRGTVTRAALCPDLLHLEES